MSAHTPGPWKFEVGDNYYISSPLLPREFPHKFKSESTGDFVAYIGNHAPDFGEANARLIAAAPDMYEALKATLRELTACANQLTALGYASRDGGSVHSAQQEARAALAKARGCIWHFDAIKADYDAMKLRAEQAEARLAAIDSAHGSGYK